MRRFLSVPLLVALALFAGCSQQEELPMPEPFTLDAEAIGRYFSTASAVSLRGKPTNSEFIAVLGDRVSLAQKNGKTP